MVTQLRGSVERRHCSWSPLGEKVPRYVVCIGHREFMQQGCTLPIAEKAADRACGILEHQRIQSQNRAIGSSVTYAARGLAHLQLEAVFFSLNIANLFGNIWLTFI